MNMIFVSFVARFFFINVLVLFSLYLFSRYLNIKRGYIYNRFADRQVTYLDHYYGRRCDATRVSP